jgi:hypothetical protein
MPKLVGVGKPILKRLARKTVHGRKPILSLAKDRGSDG